jgi:hypothetical protein
MCIVFDSPLSHSTPTREMMSVGIYRVIRKCLTMAQTLKELILHRASPEEYLQEYGITSYKEALYKQTESSELATNLTPRGESEFESQ